MKGFSCFIGKSHYGKSASLKWCCARMKRLPKKIVSDDPWLKLYSRAPKFAVEIEEI